jgi:hypothetical protein
MVVGRARHPPVEGSRRGAGLSSKLEGGRVPGIAPYGALAAVHPLNIND